MAQLYLIRHAQASFGSDDYDRLSELGHQQAELLGEYCAQRNISFDAVICGEMLRHKQTVEGIVKALKHNSIIHDKRWNEFDFNAVVNGYLRQHQEQTPAKDAPRQQWYKVLKNAMLAWSKDELYDLQSETWIDFCERVTQAMFDVSQSEHKNLAIVSSGGAIAVFLMSVLKLQAEQAISFNLQIKNTSLSQFYFNSNGFQLNMFNAVPHLDHACHLQKITYS